MSLVKRLVIIASILIIVGIIGGILTLKPLLNDNKFIANEQYITESYDDINVNVNNMAIEFYETGEKETKVVTSGSKKHKTKVNVNNKTLNVKVSEPETLTITIPGINFSKNIPTIAIYLPEEQYNHVTVKSDNGMITAKGIDVDDLSINTVNGIVTLDSIHSQHTNIATENGKISLKNITGDLKSESTNGMISYETDHMDQNIEFKTVNGLISIESAKRPTNATFDLSVELGKVDVYGSNDSHIVFGEGENKIKLTTSIGKVKVK